MHAIKQYPFLFSLYPAHLTQAHPNLVSITIGDEDIGTLLCQSEYATPTNPTH